MTPAGGRTLKTLLRVESIRVTMADVDAAAVLYFTTPFRWQESLFTGWLQELGHPVSALLAAGHGCPAVETRAEFLEALGLDDLVRCELHCVDVGRSSFGVALTAVSERTGRPAARTHTRQVYCERDADGVPRSTPMPGWLREALTGAAHD